LERILLKESKRSWVLHEKVARNITNLWIKRIFRGYMQNLKVFSFLCPSAISGGGGIGGGGTGDLEGGEVG
jgi:uncharacterized membrane protein